MHKLFPLAMLLITLVGSAGCDDPPKPKRPPADIEDEPTAEDPRDRRRRAVDDDLERDPHDVREDRLDEERDPRDPREKTSSDRRRPASPDRSAKEAEAAEDAEDAEANRPTRPDEDCG